MMNQIKIFAISFGSFVKLFTLSLAAAGFSFGCLMLALSLFGMDVYFRWGYHVIHGVAAGILNFFTMPLFSAMAGVLLACIGFFPFKWCLYKMGLTLTVEYSKHEFPSTEQLT